MFLQYQEDKAEDLSISRPETPLISPSSAAAANGPSSKIFNNKTNPSDGGLPAKNIEFLGKIRIIFSSSPFPYYLIFAWAWIYWIRTKESKLDFSYDKIEKEVKNPLLNCWNDKNLNLF